MKSAGFPRLTSNKFLARSIFLIFLKGVKSEAKVINDSNKVFKMGGIVIVEKKLPICQIITKEKLIDLRKNYEIKKIAEMYNRSPTSIIRLINKYGLEKKSGWLTRKYPYVLIKYYYIDLEMCTREIAQKLGEKQKRIAYLITLYKLGRDTSSANKLSRKKNPRININFFKRETREFWYIIGLLLTDGSINDDGTITLGLVDKETIDWVAHTIGYKNKIYVSKPTEKKLYINGKEVKSRKTNYGLAFHNDEVAEILKNYGLVPRKSKIVKCPIVPDEFLGDFLRGILDGDGTIPVWEIKRVYGDIVSHRGFFNVSTASKDFTYGIKQCVERLIGGNREVKLKTGSNSSPMYAYGITLKEDLIKLANKLYQGEPYAMSYKRENFRILQDEGIIQRIYKSSISEGEVTRNEIDYLYNEKGYNVKRLSEHFKKSHTAMLDIMDKFCIKRKRKGTWRIKKIYFEDLTTMEELFDLYVQKKLSTSKILEIINTRSKTNYSVGSLYALLNKFGILPEFDEYHMKKTK